MSKPVLWYGALLLGEISASILARLEALPVGLDLLEDVHASAAPGPASARAANEILDAMALLLGEAETIDLVRRFAADGTFSNPFVLKDDREIIDFRVDTAAGLALIERDVRERTPPESQTVIERVIRRALDRHGIAAPSRRPRSDRAAGYHQVFDSERRASPLPHSGNGAPAEAPPPKRPPR
ncbi:MAG: hypothetical protein JW751_18475 [Polyangiaceae bacterium]|nr:hypothetical protein [Polyangiaceae bacterium]